MKSRFLFLNSAVPLIVVAVIVAACAIPLSPRSVEHYQGAKVILNTPYGPSARGGGDIPATSYQSTVLPVNLASVIDHFEVALLSTGNLPARPTEYVAWNEARQFVFEDVPAGTWTVQAEAFDANGRRIARGIYPSSVIVANGQVTGVPSVIAVSPVRTPGSSTGDFHLTLREVPAAVDTLSMTLQSVVLESDGTFTLTDALAGNLSLVSGMITGIDGQPLAASITGTDLPVGSYVLGVEFHRNGAADLVSTFTPQFTVEIYDNLESTLDVTLSTDTAVNPSSAPSATSLTVDANGDAVLHWNPLYNASHYQIARAVNPNTSTQPTSPSELTALTTVPNYGYLSSWNSGINVGEQTNGHVRFWIRSVVSGLYPSPWTSVTASQRTLYVRADGNDANAGTQASPLLTLQKALDIVQITGSTSLPNTINMAGGNYPVTTTIVNATRDVPGTPAGDEQPVAVSILGGWNGTFTVRDPLASPTVIDDQRISPFAGQEAILRIDQQWGVTNPIVEPQVIDGLTLTMTNNDATARWGLLLDGMVDISLSRLTFEMMGVASAKLTAIDLTPRHEIMARTVRVYENVVTLSTESGTEPTDFEALHLRTPDSYSGLSATVYNNVFDLGPTGGASSRAIVDDVSDTSGSPTLSIRHNTIVTSNEAPSPGLAPLLLDRTGNVSVENNLFYNKTPGTRYSVDVTTAQETIDFRNNVLEGFGATSVRVGGTDYSAGAVDSPLSPGSTSNLVATAGFVVFANPAGNYRLASGTASQVLATGLTANIGAWGFDTDISGTPRGLNWHPGAYQSSAVAFMFTNAGATGRFGPSQAQLDNTYTGTSLSGGVVTSTTNNGTPGIQRWVVPLSGTYRLEAFGAQGAVYNASWGRGAAVAGDFVLSAGDVIWILVGQQGVAGNTGLGNYGTGGGGGGTFIGTGPALGSAVPLLVAGGGGASGNNGANSLSHGNVGSDGFAGGGDTADGNASNNAGGTSGSAGGRGLKQSGYANPTEIVMDAAAGWSGSGVTSQSFLTGGAGANGDVTRLGEGGFGGGGSLYISGLSNFGLAYAGGGGGYSGGGASDGLNGMTFWGGGGGSYNSGSNQSATGGVHSGQGLVLITRY